jgi:sarcosine oxidase subunit beta
MTLPAPHAAPLPDRAEIVIVGGGIQGLSLAFNLADRGVRDVVVLDAGYWQGGASGRNGGLIRDGFATPEWTRLFDLSCREWRGWSRRLGHNVMFSRRGYTMVAETTRTAAMLEGAAAVHRQCGVTSKLLSRTELRALMPAIAQDRVVAALHLENGGVAPHHAAMAGLLIACRAAGIGVHYRSAVTGFERAGGRMAGVTVGEHRIAASTVVIAGGGHNLLLAELACVPLAGYSMRIEAMALEPTRPLLDPAVALIDSLCYLHQTARGEIVGGSEIPERPRMSLNTDLPVMATTARIYLTLFPRFGELRILRHWAGMIHASPDFGPLLGRHPAVDGLWFSAGWSYGFAGAPAGGALLAQAIATGTIDERMRPFAVDRFERGAPVHEAGIVLATE